MGCRYIIIQHVNAASHKKKLEVRELGKATTQPTLLQMLPESSSEFSSAAFASDLVKTMVSCDIPLNKVEHPNVQEFISKYCLEKVPSRRTLTRVTEESNSITKKTTDRLMGQNLFLMVDETTDCLGRSMTAVLAGRLDGEFLSRLFLLNHLDIKAANKENIQQANTGALLKVLGDNLDYNKVHLLVTDGASACIKAGCGLKQLFPNMMRMTCICDGLNRVAEMDRSENPSVDQLIGEVKKVSLNGPQDAKSLFQSLLLPPKFHLFQGPV